jgi:hypothetical protein
MGTEHGALLREDILSAVENYLRRGEEYYGVPYDVLCSLGVECASHLPEAYVREMRAVAEASEAPVEAVFGLNCLVDVDAAHADAGVHCCNFLARRAASVGGRLIHGRNLDFPHAGILPKAALVTFRRPSEGNALPTVGLSWAGHIGFLTGCNAARISVGEVGSPVSNPTLEGIAFPLLLRNTLERCSRLEECVAHVRQSPRTCGYNITFCSGAEEDGVVLECTPSVVGQRPFYRDLIAVSGLCLTPHAARDRRLHAADVFRHARLTQLLVEARGRLDVPLSIEILRDRYDPAWGKARGRGFNCLCNEYTVHSAVFLPAEGRMYVAQGTIPAPMGTYHEVSLASLR